MANKYYYLVSSLPYLAFDEKAPTTEERFISECRRWLTPGDLNTLLGARAQNFDVGAQDKGIIRQWKDFDVTLRKALAEIREAMKQSLEKRMPDLVREIFDRDTPLDKEKRFEQIRWNFLEGKEFDYHFDVNWLVVYFLKIQILKRLAAFEREKGGENFQKACEVKHG